MAGEHQIPRLATPCARYDEQVPNVFDSCFGLATSPGNLVIAVARSFVADLLNPMYQAREREDSKLTGSMLRLAEHVAAEIALNTLAGPSKALPSKVLRVRSMFSLEFMAVGDVEFKEGLGYIAKVGPWVV